MTDDFVRDVVGEYLDELIQVPSMLDRRYDDIKSGRVKPIDGEKFFEELKVREDEARRLP
jgi:hypothetical protein